MRTKGALGRRTRAALHEAEHGKLEKAATGTLAYLTRLVTDHRKDDQVRMQAANILLPYLRPKLSAVEQTNINPEDQKTDAQLRAELAAILAKDPSLLPKLTLLVKPTDTPPGEDLPAEQLH